MNTLSLRQAILKVQKIGLDYGFTIVIVGGALVRLIGPKTKIKKIDESKKAIFLEAAEDPGVERGEDEKTTVDIDCIALSNVKDSFTKNVRNDFESLKKSLQILQKSRPDFPAVSLEPVLCHPYFPKPNTLFQFVSSIESYSSHGFFFRLGTAKQDVQKSSLVFWTYTFTETGQQIVSFSPLAIQRRYAIRGFSIKPKDKEKIWGEKSFFAKFVADFNKKTKNVYEKDFIEWDEFAKQIDATKNSSMIFKKTLWNFYWQTIGNYLAHGTGFVGKLLLPLGNTFFAGK